MQLLGHSGCSARWIALLALLAGPTASAPAGAQCGAICIYEAGSPQMGSSEAGAAAEARDASTALFNPAGMTRIERADTIQGLFATFGDFEFNVDRSDSNPPPGGFTNGGGNAADFVPALGSHVVLPLADELGPLEDLRFGLGVAGLFGGAAGYDDHWIGRFFITDVSMTIVNLQPGLAVRVADWLSLGAAANVFWAQLAEFQLNGGALGKLDADGADDFHPTFTVGALLEPREGTRLGVLYRHEADLTLRGGDAPDFEFDFTLPQGVNVALFQQLTPALALLLDAGWSDWSEFSQQSIAVGPVDISFDRRWRDTWRVAGGLLYEAAPGWWLRTGVSYDSSPVRAKYRTPDLPVSEQYRFSAGLQRRLSERISAGLTYTFLWMGNPKIRRVAIPPQAFGVVLDGDYDPAWVQFIGVNLELRFCSPLPWASCPSAPGSAPGVVSAEGIEPST